MQVKIFDGLYAFLWQSYRENNCNAYFIDNGKRILIDPGHLHLLGHVENGLKDLKIRIPEVDVVIITHGHPDHLEGAAKFSKTSLLAMSGEEYLLLRQLAGAYMQCPEPDILLREGELQIGSHQFEVLVTPGHSPASLCLYWPQKKALFTGDVIFSQSIGRSDLPGGDGAQLKASIERLSRLDIDYLLPGHGEPVLGKESVRENFRAIMEYWFRYL
jgi:hydroxyacylglutathione hydrolase